MKAQIARATGTALVLVAFFATASAATLTNVASLASTLQDQRNVCAKMAADAKSSYSLAQYKSGLDRQTAALKAEMDTRVYRVGHGSRQATDYYIQQMQNANNAQNAKDRATSDEFMANTKKVEECVVDAKQQGTSTYISFKEHHVSKPVRAQAEVLMTAWLANVDEINTSSPDGGDASHTAWKAAKAHAEVSSL